MKQPKIQPIRNSYKKPKDDIGYHVVGLPL